MQNLLIEYIDDQALLARLKAADPRDDDAVARKEGALERLLSAIASFCDIPV